MRTHTGYRNVNVRKSGEDLIVTLSIIVPENCECEAIETAVSASWEEIHCSLLEYSVHPAFHKTDPNFYIVK